MSGITDFIARWEVSGASERANYQLFLSELADVLGFERPRPATGSPDRDTYTFERPVTFKNLDGSTSTGFIDLYKRGCFVCEAKQGSEKTKPADPNQLTLLPDDEARNTRRGTAVRGTKGWDDAMLKARGQAYNYARALPTSEGWPPFLIVVDVGHVIELYADFSGTGKNYTQFPDGTRFRIALKDLKDKAVQDRLRKVWNEPHALDPSRVTSAVTRQIADRLAKLGRSFEAQGHAADTVARFLMRCLFSMFAEDVRLIPEGSFTKLLEDLRGQPQHVAPTLQSLWETMDKGGFSPVLRHDLLRFNGGLFSSSDALPVDNVQLSLLIEAAKASWREVEPAIFGTLLERALDKRQRHKLGAHYTPRSYVERLVFPTIIEPLRSDWQDVQAAAVSLAEQGKLDAARKEVRQFHRKLCETRVLDPACGSGNFLYVALEQMKRLEGEVTDLLEELGAGQGLRGLEGVTVDPHQFLGIELNPWAAAVAELVLWIGYLKWHFRTHGHATPSQPVLKDFHNIECRDAVLKWQNIAPRLDERSQPVTRWDGVRTITHPITGEQVPDPSAQIPVVDYLGAERADWPEADFIVGNPPFIGNRRMRDELGDGYVDALRSVSHKSLADADFVMFWWDKAAQLLVKPKTKLRRFGLIATNSLSQTKNRAIISRALTGRPAISFVYVIRDHPWVDAQDGASVRVAMGVCRAGKHEGKLATVVSEEATDDESVGYAVQLRVEEGKIWSNLRLGPDLDSVKPLAANRELSWQGCKLVGAGFQITPGKRREFVEANPAAKQHLPQYLAGSDITKVARLRYVVDLTGLSLPQATRQLPELVQYLTDHVKPARDHSTDKGFREKWWLFGRRRPEMRAALSGLRSYFATSEVSKHRFFVRLNWPSQLIDGSVIAIAHDDLSIFALLHSTHHKVWTLAMAGTLEDRPRYQNEVSFDPFPFPELSGDNRTRLCELANRLDEHRRVRQQMHPKLTLTQMYNVLEKLRSGAVFVGKDKDIYEKGLIGILKQLHDEIDEATTDRWSSEPPKDGQHDISTNAYDNDFADNQSCSLSPSAEA